MANFAACKPYADWRELERMTGPGKIEWYLARDGQQHGPLSQVELDKFIELGHKRPWELLWLVDFDDWRAADEVFPPRAPPQTAAHAEPVVTSTEHSSPKTSAKHPDEASGMAGSQNADSTPEQTSRNFASGRGADEASLEAASAVTQRPGQITPEDLARERRAASSNQPVAESRAGLGPKATTGGERAHPRFDVAPDRSTDPATFPSRDDVLLDDDEPAARSGWLLVAAALFVAVILGAGGLFAYNNQKMIMAFVDDLSSAPEKKDVTVIKAPPTATREAVGRQPVGRATAPEPERTAALVDPRSPQLEAASQQALPELPLLKSKLWQFAQREFGEWTEERLAEVRKLSAQSKSDEEANQYLVESFVRFRRQNATVALSASPESLAEVADAFVESLRALTTKGPQPCYAYISNGESTPELSTLYFEPAIGTKLEAQMLAIMKAVANGKAASQPLERQPPTEEDFNMLSRELAKRGWTAEDLKLFSDPNALSRAEPKLVCRLVTEWFATQTQLDNEKTRDQLIAASLRPVIGG